MTVSQLARRVDRSPEWVRGACDAYGIERHRYGRADVIAAEGCDRVVRLADSAPRHAAPKKKRAKPRARASA